MKEKRILIISDEESVNKIFKMYLELKHFEVFQASNGKLGLETAQQILPDLILLDVMMPDINGYEVCRKLKENESTRDIPVLFLSALLESREKIKGLESGGVDFINNTADYAEILARIETHLKIKDLTQQLQQSNQELILKQKTLNEDLKAAAMIQQSLLPIHLPHIPQLEISWVCLPCELVGGDICSINQLNDESSAFYVLDVSGHGVPSAMVTVSITQYLQQKQLLQASPKQVLEALNKDYPFEKFNMFSTVFYMVFNRKNGRLTYSSAGHPPGVYLSPKRSFRLLSSNGTLIGIDPSFIFDEREETLQKKDKVILYTDGVIEFINSEGKMYGSQRFYNLLESIKYQSVEEITQTISASLKEFGQGVMPRDDVSILAIEFK